MLKGWGFFSRRGTILKNVSQKWKYFFFVLVFVQEKNNSKESNSFIQFWNHKIIMKEKMKKIWGCFTPCGFSSFFFVFCYCILSNLKSIVCPTAKFHFTFLIIKRKPCYVNFACWFEYTRWHIETRAIIAHHHIRLVCAVETLISAVVHKHIRFPYPMRWYT